MKKTRAERGHGSDTNGALRVATPAPFTIERLERVEYGSKKAMGTIAVEGVGTIGIELFVLGNGARFVESQSIRSKYSGAYERTVTLSEEFSAAVLDAVLARLAADEA